MISLKEVKHYPDTNSVEATWVDEDDKPVRCHSYADVQMDMLRDDLGSDAATYADLIATVEAGIVPQPPAPKPIIVVSPWQIRKALNTTGLRDAVESAVSAGDATVKDAWQYATEFRRDNPLVNQLGTSLGKTESDLDNLFELAQTL